MKGEKTKEKKRKKRIAAIAVAGAVAVMVLVLALVNAFVFPLRYLSVLFSLPEVEARAERELALHFIDVGQGDAALIEFPDGKTLLIDGGGEESDALLRYLRALKIDTLDYLLLTHPDSDHCGGLSDVLELFGAKHIYMPYCPDETINASYAAFTSAVRKAARKGTAVHISQTFSAIVSEDEECFYYAMILLPLPYESENSAYRALVNENSDSAANDASAVVYLEYAGVRFLFTGGYWRKRGKRACQGLRHFRRRIVRQDRAGRRAPHRTAPGYCGYRRLESIAPRQRIFHVGRVCPTRFAALCAHRCRCGKSVRTPVAVSDRTVKVSRSDMRGLSDGRGGQHRPPRRRRGETIPASAKIFQIGNLP